jgi:transcriptional regulator with XRE-family HTH domain
MTDDIDPKEVGLRLKALRKAFNLSGGYVASTCGLDQSNYSKVERGKVNLTVKDAAKLCKLYDVDLDYIFLGDETHAPKRI